MSLPNLESVGDFLLSWTAKTTVIFCVAWIAAKLARRRSASFRHAIWATALLGVLAMPLLLLVVPEWRSSALINSVVVWAPGRAPVAFVGGETVPAMVVNAVMSAPTRENWMLFFVLGWMAGFAILAVRMGAGLFGLRRIFRESQTLRDERLESMAKEICAQLRIRRPVALRECTRPEAMPVTWGTLHPMILLPPSAVSWTETRQRSVLMHELAHVARRDWLMQMFGELTRAMHWFHPLAWVAAREQRRESERACDDSVLNSGVDPLEYARQLLDIASTFKSSHGGWSSALAIAKPTNLERRFTAMLHPSMERGSLSGTARALVLLIAAVVLVPLAAVRLPAQDGARIGGTISDPSSLPIANATVALTDQKTHQMQMTTSDREGKYVFAGMAAGEYELRAMKQGFAETRSTLSTFGAAREMLQNNITMEVASGNDEINVIAPGGPKNGVSGGVNGGVSGAVDGGASGGVSNRVTFEGAAKTIRLRIGGEVEAAKALEKVPPVYPEKAKAAGVQGTVILHAVIGTDGTPLSLKVMNNQIDPDLARAAVEAVSKWRYQTTLLNGEPIEVDTTIKVNFTLKP